MTRKDYVAIAQVLKAAQPGFTTLAESPNSMTERKRGWLKAVEGLADHMAADNPAFDRARFLKACGVQS